MANVANVLGWAYRDLGYNKDVVLITKQEVEASPTSGVERDVLKFKVFTDVNEYTIYATRETDKVIASGKVASSGYLGCTMSSRRPRAGETWTRGGDLPDGPLTEETWLNIVKAILRNELVKIHRTSNKFNVDQPNEPLPECEQRIVNEGSYVNTANPGYITPEFNRASSYRPVTAGGLAGSSL